MNGRFRMELLRGPWKICETLTPGGRKKPNCNDGCFIIECRPQPKIICFNYSVKNNMNTQILGHWATFQWRVKSKIDFVGHSFNLSIINKFDTYFQSTSAKLEWKESITVWCLATFTIVSILKVNEMLNNSHVTLSINFHSCQADVSLFYTFFRGYVVDYCKL